MELPVLVQLGMFLFPLFAGAGVMLAGLGLMKRRNGQERKADKAPSKQAN